jgi:hypothetical protein
MDLNQDELEKNAYSYLSNQSTAYLNDPSVKDKYEDQLPEVMKLIQIKRNCIERNTAF